MCFPSFTANRPLTVIRERDRIVNWNVSRVLGIGYKGRILLSMWNSLVSNMNSWVINEPLERPRQITPKVLWFTNAEISTWNIVFTEYDYLFALVHCLSLSSSLCLHFHPAMHSYLSNSFSLAVSLSLSLSFALIKHRYLIMLFLSLSHSDSR